ncbi:hypothetical protein [Acidovorax sp. Leaf78]|uniref:hypothetical protein n=1 Tax=Acidovorax sp. Leaf78 TaxID=1736237 RepID=UPI000A68D3B0|nr:hypothetical protein [Acidovorax sp. Leaf78]
MNSKFLPLLAFTSFAITGNANPSFDIGGIKMGSTLKEAKVTLSNISPGLVIKELKQNNGSVVGYEGRERISVGREDAGARSMAPNASIEKFVQKDHIVVLADKSDAVWFVSRTQAFAPKTPRPTAKATWEALEQKFGAPSRKSLSGGIGTGEWEFDRNLKLFTRKGGHVADAGPCTTSLSEISAGYQGTYPIYTPQSFTQQCSFSVTAKINAAESSYQSGDEGLVNNFNITVYDSARMLTQLQTEKNAADAAAKQKSNTLMEQGKGVKPAL